MRWSDPRNAPTLRHNNFTPPPGELALEVVDSSPTAPDIVAKDNYWGTQATAQMQTLGASANIDAIRDFYDDFNQAKVDYSNWSTTPYADAGPDW